MGISSPVLGLRPGRWFLSRKSKLPKPESLTCSPFERAARTSSKKRSTSSRASRLFRPSWLNSASAISALVRAISLFSYFCVQALAQIRDDGTHEAIHVFVSKSARNVLKNQPQSDAFSPGFYARSPIYIEDAQVLQKGRRNGDYTVSQGTESHGFI